MTTPSKDVPTLTPEKQALVALRKLRARVEELERERLEPLAIVGIGCRFPGAANPDAFWELLAEGRDVVREVPAERWDPAEYFDADREAPGKTYSKWAALLDGVDRFDSAFFNIAQREAVRVDPQHRLFLEVAWEALEDAAIAPPALRGAKASVFAGVTCSDYLQLHTRDLPREAIDAYLLTNNTLNMTASRVSFFLGLQGPSMAIDTACSSSLVSIDRACRSLRERECDLSIAGGVHLALIPEPFISMSKWGMLAGDGKCKTFAEGADGFVRGEGCGVVVLKRLADALANNDRIHAVIRGTAVNQDGASSALPVPNGLAQQAVIRAALANAGLEPHEVSYVEAHGTGTALGDPIEVEALGAVFAAGRSAETPLVIGSVKTNFGHLEAAAGVAGLLKVVLALRHERIPPHLHFSRPSTHIPWEALPFAVPTHGAPWESAGQPRRAGVSSFGFSGTNAHVVLEEAPHVERRSASGLERPLHLLTLSARSDLALRGLAERYAVWLEGSREEPFADICYTANTGRAHFKHRLAVASAAAARARDQLLAYVDGRSVDGVVSGETAAGGAPKIAFMFTGQGSQYVGMAKQLYETAPVFKQALDRCADLLRPHVREPLLTVLYPPPGVASPLDDTEFTQPALFSIEFALCELWRSWGVEPAFVLGHSLGELVAACVAGVLDLSDALTLVSHRARLMQAQPPGGRMAAVRAPEALVRAAIAPYSRTVSIAAVNGPANTVIAGASEDIAAIAARLADDNVQCTPLSVSHAFHSPLMEPMLAQFGDVLRNIELRSPRIRLISNLTGRVVGAEIAQSEYWQRHVREPVQFAASLETLAELGCRAFLEIGPSAVLVGMGAQCLPGQDVLWLPSLRPQRDAWADLLASAQRLYCAGVDFDWHAFDRAYARSKVGLPTYAFQRVRCWMEPPPDAKRETTRTVAARRKSAHPLLGERVDSALPVFRTIMDATSPWFLREHRIHDVATAPGPLFLEMAVAGAVEAFGVTAQALLDVTVEEPLMFPEDHSRVVELWLRPGVHHTGFEIFSRSSDAPSDHAWTRHCAGSVASGGVATDRRVDIAGVQRRCVARPSSGDFYRALGARGLAFGESVRGVRELWCRDGEALGRIELTLPDTESDSFGVHPVLLDSYLHVVAAAIPGLLEPAADVYLYVGMEALRRYARLGPSTFAHVVLDPPSQPLGERRGTLVVCEADGRVLLEIVGLRLRRATRAALTRASRRTRSASWLHKLDWDALTLSSWEGGESRHFPEPAELGAAAAKQFPVLVRDNGMAAYDELLPVLRTLSADFAMAALQQLGVDVTPGASFEPNALAASAGVVSAQRRLLHRLIEILVDAGALRASGDAFELVSAASPSVMDERRAAAAHAYAAQSGEISLLLRCGGRLADVMRGKCDPLQLLFPGGEFEEAERIYASSPSARTFNALLRDTVLAAVSSVPDGRRVRILEVGAGTGGSTSALLPQLPPERVDYWFTDVSASFVARARERFHRFPQLTARALDIERDPASQGFGEQSFDIVIAANCLHATVDLRRTMAHVRGLLADRGLLLLLEGTAAESWIDLTFGMTDGWWRFTDTQLRQRHPLLSAPRWTELLAELGFDGANAVPSDPEAVRDPARQALLIARASARAFTTVRGCVVFADEQGVGTDVAAALRERGDRVAVVRRGDIELDATRGARGSDMAEEESSGVSEAYARAAAAVGPVTDVVYLLALDAAADGELDLAKLGSAQNLAAGVPLEAMRALAAAPLPRPRLWLVTAGAQTVGATGGHSSAAQALLWGLGRVFALEHPDVAGALIDVDPAASAAAKSGAVLQEILCSDGEDQVAYRRGRRWVARLRSAGAPHAAAPFELRADGAYLVTGGLGGLGRKVAAFLAASGARHLVLVGRTAAVAEDAIRSIEALGVRVTIAQCDVANRTQLETLLARFGADLPALRGIVHAAVDLTTMPLAQMTRAQLDTMLRAKVAGTWLLHELSRTHDLDLFVTFSSTTSLLGAKGLGHYAAANQFLDSFADYRAACGLPVLNVNWGTWDVMRLATQADQELFSQAGLRAMPSDEALAILGDLCAARATRAVVADIDWPALRRVYEARRRRPLLTDLGAIAARDVQKVKPAAVANELVQQLRTSDAERAQELLAEHVRACVAQVLRVDLAAVASVNEGFFQMGMDSLMTVELRNRLEASLGLKLPPTLAFEFSTVDSLTAILLGDLRGPDGAPAETMAAPQRVETPKAAEELRSELDALADDELAALLDQQVGRLLGGEANR